MADKVISVRLRAIVDQYQRELNDAARSTSSWADKTIDKADRVGRKMQGLGTTMTAGVTLPLLAIGTSFVNAASDLQESNNVVGLVFEDMRGEIDETAEKSVEFAGLSKRAFYDATSNMGGLLTNLGFGREETTQWSLDLVQLAADMGSAFNTSTEDAIGAIGAGLRGEAEPLKRFNIFLSETEVKAKAVEMGLANTAAEVDRNAGAQARLQLIMEQTNAVQGDWANTQDQTAGSLKTARAEYENAAAAMGETLLPIVADGATMVADLMRSFQDLSPKMQDAIIKFGMLAAALGPALVITGSMLRSVKVLRDTVRGFDWGKMSKTKKAVAGLMAVYAAAQLLDSIFTEKFDVSGAVEGLEQLAETGESAKWQAATGNIDGLRNSLNLLLDEGFLAGGSRLFASLYDVVGMGPKGPAVEQLNAVTDALAEMVESDNLEAAGRGFIDLQTAADQAGVPIEDIIESSPRLQDALAEAGISVDDLSTLYHDNRGAAEENAGAQEEVAVEMAKVEESAGALVVTLDDVLDSYREMTGGARDMRAAEMEVQAAIDEVTASVKENGQTLDINTEKGRSNQQALDKLQEAAQEHALAVLEETGSVEGANAVLDDYRDQLYESAIQAGMSEQAAREYAAEVEDIPDDHGTDLWIDSAEGQRAVDRWKRHLKTVPWDVTTHGKFFADQDALARWNAKLERLNRRVYTTGVFKSEGGVTRASGGPVGPAYGGGWTVVGEEGPELVRFSAPGYVYSAEETRRMTDLGSLAPQRLAGAAPSSNDLSQVDVGAEVASALAGMSWELRLDPTGVARVVARGNHDLAARGGKVPA